MAIVDEFLRQRYVLFPEYHLLTDEIEYLALSAKDLAVEANTARSIMGSKGWVESVFEAGFLGLRGERFNFARYVGRNRELTVYQNENITLAAFWHIEKRLWSAMEELFSRDKSAEITVEILIYPLSMTATKIALFPGVHATPNAMIFADTLLYWGVYVKLSRPPHHEVRHAIN